MALQYTNKSSTVILQGEQKKQTQTCLCVQPDQSRSQRSKQTLIKRITEFPFQAFSKCDCTDTTASVHSNCNAMLLWVSKDILEIVDVREFSL